MINFRSGATLGVFIVILVMTSCRPAVQTTPVAINTARYDPAVSSYPASIGVYFPADFFDNNFYHETDDDYHLVFHNNPADATRKALDLALTESFAEVRYLDTLQQGFAEEGLAFVVVPNIVSMPSRLDPEVIAVGITYQFEFFAEGKHLQTWQISGLDYVKRLSAQRSQALTGMAGQNYRPSKISAEKYDDVARGAVWDAVSVLLARLNQQALLTGRLPSPAVNVISVKEPFSNSGSPMTLGLVGPVYDQEQNPAKNSLEDCLVEGLQENENTLQTIAQRNLRDQLYPWLSRSNYPQGVHALQATIKEPAVKQRLQKLGIEYILSWDGETTSSQFSGPFYITAYGVIGYESSDKMSNIRADLLAVADGRIVTTFESTREGTETVLGLVWVSVPILTDTEGAVCEEISHEIDMFLQSMHAANRKSAGVLAHK